jgi:hypothetical protein
MARAPTAGQAMLGGTHEQLVTVPCEAARKDLTLPGIVNCFPSRSK